jgi:hypothetical protein
MWCLVLVKKRKIGVVVLCLEVRGERNFNDYFSFSLIYNDVRVLALIDEGVL